MRYYTFTTIAMDRGLPDADWRTRLRTEFASNGVRMVGPDDAAELWMGDQLVGWARFDDLDGFGDLPALRAWIGNGEHPWAGRPAGVLRWTHPMASGQQKRQIVRAIALTARGAIWNRSQGELLEPLVTRRCTLVDLTDPYGLDEGEALLERTPGPYLHALIERVRIMLHDAGVDADVGVEPRVSGNPLRLDPHLYRTRRLATGALSPDHDHPVPDADVNRILYGLGDLEFVGVDRDLGDDPFWDD